VVVEDEDDPYIQSAVAAPWVWAAIGGLPSGPAGGDLSGTYPDPRVRHLGNRTFVVTPQSQYTTIQAAVVAAEALIPFPSYYNGAIILVGPGDWAEDVVIRHDSIHLVGLCGQGCTKIRSVTYTDATLVSLAAFNASGDPSVLVKDATLLHPPSNNQIREIEIDRWVNSPVWAGDARASLRILGSPVAGTSFMGNEMLAWGVTLRAAAGAAAGKGALYACFSNYVSFMDSWVAGGAKIHNVAGLWFDHVNASVPLGSHTVETFYDTAQAEPSDSGNYGLNARHSRFGKLWLSGPDSRCGQDYNEENTFDSVDHDGTSVLTSIFEQCYVRGAFDMAAVGPLVTFRAGRYMVAISGLGAVGFTGVVGNNS
jgi:hypothetical protein